MYKSATSVGDCTLPRPREKAISLFPLNTRQVGNKLLSCGGAPAHLQVEKGELRCCAHCQCRIGGGGRRGFENKGRSVIELKEISKPRE